MKKLPILLAVALCSACNNPTTSADDTDKAGGATMQDRAGSPENNTDSTAQTNVSGGVGGQGVDHLGTDRTPPEDPAQPGRSTTPDANFVNSALADGMFEVQMSERVLKTTKDAATREFAQRMVTDHTKVGDELRRLAAQQQMNVTDRLNRDQAATLGQMEKLGDQELRKLYAETAVKGHETAVTLFRTAAQGATRPELRQFATRHLPTLEMHLKMAQDLQAGRPMKQM